MAFLTPPPMRVTLSSDRIRIHDGRTEWSYAPAVWFDAAAGKTMGIGDAAVPGAQYLKLFEPTPLPAGLDRQWLLAGFFLKALNEAMRTRWLKVKPAVTVFGIESLAPILHGYERSIIKAALTTAGAMSVEFA